MTQTIQEFFHDFRQTLIAEAEAGEDFQLATFMQTVTDELRETGFIEGFEYCHYRAQRGMRVDGYWFNDEGILDLFIADFDSRDNLDTLTRTEVTATFKRLENFFTASKSKNLHSELEETSPGYGLARDIADRGKLLRKVNFHLLSERVLSERLQTLPDTEIASVPATWNIWDISRLHRQHSARGHKEALDIDFRIMFGNGIPCLPAHLATDSYQSYLIVMPAEILSQLYEKFGARLLEQNVRAFLQARNKVNKGIRNSILNEPAMFFAYNNGITATAQEVQTANNSRQITRIKDLQIVNGGQTTASIFHTRRNDKASLEKVFVQMKLSVIPPEQSENAVQKISEYANTQNRVNAADFFSNHPFHIRIEEFSRRIWAPAHHGAQRETKWFYERARGQYADAQSAMTPAQQRHFKAEYPKPQMFTKTDLAKFENVWDEHPRAVNHGAQQNFAIYARRIGAQWGKSPQDFNEYHYRRAIARAIIFRQTEKLVSAQPWYNGGYRANIVAYAIAMLKEIIARHNKQLDFLKIWSIQSLPQSLEDALTISGKYVNDIIMHPPPGISTVSGWCKRSDCWQRLQSTREILEQDLPQTFFDDLVSNEHQPEDPEDPKSPHIQKIDDGIAAQRLVLAIPSGKWAEILRLGQEKSLFSPKEFDILELATQIPNKIPSVEQSAILIQILEKAKSEGIAAPRPPP